jgi:hypothetical protein
VKLARFLAEAHRRTRVPIPDDVDPIGVIMARVGMHPYTPESRALAKACFAVIAMEGEMSEADLWALSADALALLDRFAVEFLAKRYPAKELEVIAKRLRNSIAAS